MPKLPNPIDKFVAAVNRDDTESALRVTLNSLLL